MNEPENNVPKVIWDESEQCGRERTGSKQSRREQTESEWSRSLLGPKVSQKEED